MALDGPEQVWRRPLPGGIRGWMRSWGDPRWAASWGKGIGWVGSGWTNPDGGRLGPDLLCQRRPRRVREGPGEEDGGGSGVRGAMGAEPAFPRIAGDKGGRPSC